MQQYTYLSWGRIVDRIGMAASRSEMRQSDSAHLKYCILIYFTRCGACGGSAGAVVHVLVADMLGVWMK